MRPVLFKTNIAKNLKTSLQNTHQRHSPDIQYKKNPGVSHYQLEIQIKIHTIPTGDGNMVNYMSKMIHEALRSCVER